MRSNFLNLIFGANTSLSSMSEMTFLSRNWGWVMTSAVLFMILGVIALSLPVASTVAVAFGLAGILLVGGCVQFVEAFKLRHSPGSAARFIQSVLSVVVGGLILRYPGGGILGISLALSFYFFVGAATKWMLASYTRTHRGFNWGFVSSIASFALGVYLIASFPFSALWVPGVLLGVDLIVTGTAMFAVSLSLRRMHKELAEPQRREGKIREEEQRDLWH